MALRREGFWDEHYGEELNNFDDAGDEGEVWFGRGLSRKICAQVVDRLKTDVHYGSLPKIEILDIGCGNGFLISNLALQVKNQYDKNEHAKCHYMGIDYSANSIELSKKILATKDLDISDVTLRQCNFLDCGQIKEECSSKKFHFVIDVGTYDAICLLSSESESKLSQTQIAYMRSLYTVVQDGTTFFLASCNHTRDELMCLFELDCPLRLPVTLVGEIETPKLRFGGQEGSQVSCLIIKFGLSPCKAP